MAWPGAAKEALSGRLRHDQQLKRRVVEKTACEDAKGSENVITVNDQVPVSTEKGQVVASFRMGNMDVCVKVSRRLASLSTATRAGCQVLGQISVTCVGGS